MVDAPSTTGQIPSFEEIYDPVVAEHPDEDQQFEDDIYPFGLVLWNDEQHSFNEVISQVDEAISCGRVRAKHVAENVDVHVSYPFKASKQC